MIYHVYVQFKGKKINIESFDHIRNNAAAKTYVKNRYSSFNGSLENELGVTIATYTKEEQGK